MAGRAAQSFAGNAGATWWMRVQPAVRELVMVTQPCGPALKNQWVIAMSWPHDEPSQPAAPPGQPLSRTSQSASR